MKNIFIIIFICILFILSYYSPSNNLCKVFKIVSPCEIFIDNNKNLIFDETQSFRIDNIYYITINSNFSSNEFLKNLSYDEKVFLYFSLKQYVEKILLNRFISIKNDEIYINNKKYKDILLESNLVFDESDESKRKLYEYVKSINLNDYVLYNKKTKKYHKLSCEHIKKNNNFVLIKHSQLPDKTSACGICYNLNKNTDKIIKNSNNIKDVFVNKNFNVFYIPINSVYNYSNTCSTSACKALKNEISNSKYSIDFAIYGINNQSEILNELLNAQKRGVKIRYIVDYDKKKGNYYSDTKILTDKIQSYNTDENYDKNNQSAIMHNKFFIFDNSKVWTGSANITGTDLSIFNANYSILINSKKIAEIYTKEFEQMYNGAFHKDKKILKNESIVFDDNTKMSVYFSPQDNVMYSQIIPLIKEAKRYIYIPIFFITHKDLAQALINAKNNGVDVKVINDATNAHTKYSVHKLLRQAGIKVKTENYAGKMHMKSIIIDDKISVIGSMNYTKSANNKNDENILIIYNKYLAVYMKKTFFDLWNKIPEKYEYIDPRAESLESIGSCFDGIDNDFDGKIDKQDEACLIN